MNFKCMLSALQMLEHLRFSCYLDETYIAAVQFKLLLDVYMDLVW